MNFHKYLFILPIFLFGSVPLRATVGTVNLSDLVCGRVQLNTAPQALWQLKSIQNGAGEANRIWRSFDSAREKTQSLAIVWFHQNKIISENNHPVHPHFNKAFGLFLKDSLLFSEVSPVLDTAIFAVADLVLLATERKSIWLEMLADLLLMKKGGDYCYLAAAAYQRAASFSTDEATHVAWDRKAIFAMEKRIVNSA